LKDFKKIDLYVYDDDVNNYEFVSHTLSALLSYPITQAESCVRIIERLGKYKVKTYAKDESYVAETILKSLLSYNMKAELVYS